MAASNRTFHIVALSDKPIPEGIAGVGAPVLQAPCEAPGPESALSMFEQTYPHTTVLGIAEHIGDRWVSVPLTTQPALATT